MEKQILKRKSPVLILSLLVIAIFTIELLLLDDLIKVEGIRIGLYNVFIVYAIMSKKNKITYALFLVKLIFSLFITSPLLMYPVLGGILSITVMIFAKKLLDKKIGYIGIGIVGAITYNITVYLIASLSLKSLAVFYNIPSVLFLSVLIGTATGCLAYLTAKTKIIPTEFGGNNENR